MMLERWCESMEQDLRSVALNPMAGEPDVQVLNSHGEVRFCGGAVEDPVPDLLLAGAERTTYTQVEKWYDATCYGGERTDIIFCSLQGGVFGTYLSCCPSIIICQDDLRFGVTHCKECESE